MSQESTKSEFDLILEAADKLVESYMKPEDYESPKAGKTKLLHDSVWGTIRLNPGEAALIDLPIYQRLRFIHQTSFVFLVYPGARHSRLEHSIGVMHMVTRMARLLNECHPGRNLVSDADLRLLRVAALLHDIGHGPFSHISEYAYQSHSWFKVLKKNSLYCGKPSETLSGLVILSRPFREIFSKLQSIHDDLKEVNLDDVVSLIYGTYDKVGTILDESKRLSTGHRSYLSSLINGPFDADKLDYISRDRHNTGLDLLVDIERLLSSMEVRLMKEEGKSKGVFRLVLNRAGITALEHIVQSKLQLSAAVYCHPKVRATDAMFQRFMNHMHTNSGSLEGHFKLASPLDFLKHSDLDFLNEGLHSDRYLSRVVGMFRRRELPVRVIEISHFTVEKEAFAEVGMVIGGKDSDRQAQEASIALEIYQKLSAQGLADGFTANDVIVDLPRLPSVSEASKTWLVLPGGETVMANSRFKTDDWLVAYTLNKWRGHVFCPPKMLSRRLIDICLQVLGEQLKIQWKSNLPEVCAKSTERLTVPGHG